MSETNDWYEAAPSFIPEAEIAAIRAHPRFREAIYRSSHGAADLYRTDALMYRALKDQARFVIGTWALYLHAQPGGLTLASVKALCNEVGMCSPGTAHALLLQLKVIGYIDLMGRSVDGRVKAYYPTARMNAAFRKRMRHEIEAVALVDPTVLPAVEGWEEPGVFDTFITIFGRGILESARVHVPNPKSGMTLFSKRSAGMSAIYNLVSMGDPANGGPPRGPFPFTLSEIARRCSVSRTHVMRMFREVEQAGFITLDPEAGTAELSPALIDEMEYFYSIVFLGIGAAARRAAEHRISMSRAA